MRDWMVTTKIRIHSLEEPHAASDTVEKNFTTPGRLPFVMSVLRLLQKVFDPALFHRSLLVLGRMKRLVLKLKKKKAFAVARTILLGNPKGQGPAHR